jgi:hypothetical protein
MPIDLLRPTLSSTTEKPLAYRLLSIIQIASVSDWWFVEKHKNGYESFEPLSVWLRGKFQIASDGGTIGDEFENVIGLSAFELARLNTDLREGANLITRETIHKKLLHSSDFDVVGVKLKSDIIPRNLR